MPVFPTDFSRHVMYSLTNPSESERPFSTLAARLRSWFCRHWAGKGGRGTERIAYAVQQGRQGHWPRRSHDPKGPISLALGSWRWGGGYGEGEGWGLGMKGRGVEYFYRRPVPTSITLAFFKSVHAAHTPCGIKRPTISKFWSFK